MSELIDFSVHWAKKHAKEFTDIYVRQGRAAASAYTKKHIPLIKQHLVRVYVIEEFKKRNINVPGQ